MGTKFTVSDLGVVTLTNDLIVDADVLKVDTTNNRVGVNVASPTAALDVLGAISASGTITGNLFAGSGASLTSIPASAVDLSGYVPYEVGTSALVNLTSTTKGFLVPRMTSVQRLAISTPAIGLMVYDTDFSSHYVYKASGWSAVGSGGGGGGGTAYSRLTAVGDGTTVTFTTPTYVLGNDSVLVYNDGVLMTKGALADYTETSVTSVTFNVPPASGAYLSFVVGTGSAVGSSGGSYWVKTTKTYTDFSTAALTNSISLGITLLPQQVLRGVVIKHSAAFSGPGITGYNVSLGLSGNNAKYASAFDVYQAASATTSQSSLDMFVENFSTFTTVTVTATSIGANLSAATAGIVDIWTLIDTLP